MEKVLDLRNSIYDICMKDSMAKSILLNLGLTAVANQKAIGGLRNRTIPQVAPIRGHKLDEIIARFEEKGYTIEGR